LRPSAGGHPVGAGHVEPEICGAPPQGGFSFPWHGLARAGDAEYIPSPWKNMAFRELRKGSRCPSPTRPTMPRQHWVCVFVLFILIPIEAKLEWVPTVRLGQIHITLPRRPPLVAVRAIPSFTCRMPRSNHSASDGRRPSGSHAPSRLGQIIRDHPSP